MFGKGVIVLNGTSCQVYIIQCAVTLKAAGKDDLITVAMYRPPYPGTRKPRYQSYAIPRSLIPGKESSDGIGLKCASHTPSCD